MSHEWLILDENAQIVNEHVLYCSDELTVLRPGSKGFKMYVHGNELRLKGDASAPTVTVLGTTCLTSSQVDGKWTVEEMDATIARNHKLARKPHQRALSSKVRYDRTDMKAYVFGRGVCFDESMYTALTPESHCRAVLPFESVPADWF
jgi:hypothetical protein